jgi:diphosphoinositol-polyphosphate diphosphatase
MKIRSPTDIRVCDSEGFKQRAACLCFRDARAGGHELVLVSSSKSSEKWVVPGGGVCPLEDPEAAAAREAFEEAGVRGSIIAFLGVFENMDRRTRTSVYVLVVEETVDDWEEAKSTGRRRSWFSVAEAKEQLQKHKPVQQSYLEKLSGERNIFEKVSGGAETSRRVEDLCCSKEEDKVGFATSVKDLSQTPYC